MDIKRKKQLLLAYILLMGIGFSLFIIVFMYKAARHGADPALVIPVTLVILLMINGTFAFGYLRNVKYLIKLDSQDLRLGEEDKKQIGYRVLIGSLMMLVITIICIALLYFKKMILPVAVILIISGLVFLSFLRKQIQKGVFKCP